MRKTIYTCDICGKAFRETGTQTKSRRKSEEEYLRYSNVSITTVNIKLLFEINWNADLCKECLVEYAPVTDEVKRVWGGILK